MAAPFQLEWESIHDESIHDPVETLEGAWNDRLLIKDFNCISRGYLRDLRDAHKPGTIGVLKELIAAREAATNGEEE